MKQISTFMGDIADEFKIVVVEAIKNLCIKYPQKHRVLLNFLANFLREEGGYEFKKTITDSILFLIDRIPECKESGLLHLCEFIEDCEFTQLSTKILRVLGHKGPTTSAPSRYIRFIRNRIILENAAVRASAVSALAQFAIRVEPLRQSVASLLVSCKLDDDDEVRDRATMYLSILDRQASVSRALLVDDFPMSVAVLQKSIEQYGLRPSEGPITFEALPHVEVVEEVKVNRQEEEDAASSSQPAAAAPPQDVAKELYKVGTMFLPMARFGYFMSLTFLFSRSPSLLILVQCSDHRSGSN
jgi:coatomer subunit gamma